MYNSRLNQPIWAPPGTITWVKSHIIEPRKIEKQDDIRPGTKVKGKLDRKDIWVVEIQMPKKLIMDIYGGSFSTNEYQEEPAVAPDIASQPQTADEAVPAAPEGETV